MPPFFSVIITNYNRSAQLVKVVESVQGQTFTDYELIVVDDCSTDESLEVLSGYQSVRSYSTAENSGGPAKPRNIGIGKARGLWLCFCDSDDLFTPGHLQGYHAFIQRMQLEEGIISSNAFLIKTGVATTETYFSNAKGNSFEEISLLQDWRRNRAILSTTCYRNKNLVRFREGKQYQTVEDYIFLLENMLNGKKHYYTPAPTVMYNMASEDSIRSLHSNGYRVYSYKWELLQQYALWKRADGLAYLSSIGVDLLKSGIRKISRRREGHG